MMGMALVTRKATLSTRNILSPSLQSSLLSMTLTAASPPGSSRDSARYTCQVTVTTTIIFHKRTSSTLEKAPSPRRVPSW